LEFCWENFIFAKATVQWIAVEDDSGFETGTILGSSRSFSDEKFIKELRVHNTENLSIVLGFTQIEAGLNGKEFEISAQLSQTSGTPSAEIFAKNISKCQICWITVNNSVLFKSKKSKFK
jgi:hypothetical protein